MKKQKNKISVIRFFSVLITMLMVPYYALSATCTACGSCSQCTTNVVSDSVVTVYTLPYSWSDPGSGACTASGENGTCSASGGTSCNVSILPVSSSAECVWSSPTQLPSGVTLKKKVHSCTTYSCNCYSYPC